MLRLANHVYRLKTVKEINAAAELGCHSVTLSPALLEELVNTKYDGSLDLGVPHLKPQGKDFYTQLPNVCERLQPLLITDSLRSSTGSPQQARLDVDYLANEAAELVRALENDPEGKKRLEEAIEMFVQAEQSSKDLIETVAGPSHL